MVPRSTVAAPRLSLAFPRVNVSAARLALHVSLLAATFLTTTVVGVVFARDFQAGKPILLDDYLNVFGWIQARPMALLEGLPFSLTLMTILLAHELGHYIACLRYGIDASMPYFLPFPSPAPLRFIWIMR